MKEEFKGEAFRDFNQRYAGTYGWYEMQSKKHLLVKLIEATETTCKFSDENGGNFTAIADKGNCFHFLPVQRGVYNTDTYGVIFVRRHPARQYKRGICEQNTNIMSLSTGGTMNLSFELVREMFEPSKTQERWVNEFRAGKIRSCAVSNVFAFVGQNMMLYNHAIGSIQDKTIVLHNSLFEQEVKDMVAKHGFTFDVRVA